MLNYLAPKLLLEFEGDEAHDEHNACQWAVQQCRWMPSMVLQKQIVILSVNKAPYGTGAFFLHKQEAHADLIRQGAQSATYQRHKEGLADDAGVPVPRTASEDDAFLRTISEYGSFTKRECGIKSSRFFSVQSPALEYDLEWTAQEMVLEHYLQVIKGMSDSALVDMLQQSSELLERLDPTKDIRRQLYELRGSGENSLILALKLHSPGQRMDMRIITTCFAAVYRHHSRRAADKHTPSDTFEWCQREARCWTDVLVEHIQRTFYNVDKLQYMGLTASMMDIKVAPSDTEYQEETHRAAKVFELSVHILQRRSIFLIMKHWARPGADALLLTNNPQELGAAIAQYQREWRNQLAGEKLALSSRDMKALMGCIHWLSWPVTRVTPLLLEAEGWSRGPRCTEWLHMRFHGWRESLLVEQAAHYLRNLQVDSSNNLTTLAARFWKCVRCPMLTNRSEVALDLEQVDFDQATNKKDTRVWRRETFTPPKKGHIPKPWSSFLLPNKDWRSPSPEGAFASVVAYQWMQAWFSKHKDKGIACDAPWWTMMAPQHHIVSCPEKKHYLVLQTATYGGLMWEVTAVEDDLANQRVFSLKVDGSALQMVFITDPVHWRVHRVDAQPPMALPEVTG